MFRSFGGVFAGFIVMLIVVSSIQWMGMSFFPTVVPGNGDGALDAQTRTALAPLGSLLMELASFAVGSFLGAATATTLSLRHKRGVAVVIGVAMVGMAAVKFLTQDYPTWMTVSGLLIPLPFALLGWRVFR